MMTSEHDMHERNRKILFSKNNENYLLATNNIDLTYKLREKKAVVASMYALVLAIVAISTFSFFIAAMTISNLQGKLRQRDKQIEIITLHKIKNQYKK